jgi:hypothetical protein
MNGRKPSLWRQKFEQELSRLGVEADKAAVILVERYPQLWQLSAQDAAAEVARISASKRVWAGGTG